MKQLSVLALFALTLTSTLAQAEIRLPSFKQLCSYESDCSKVGSVKNGQLTYRQPNTTLLNDYYSQLRGLIIRIADQYGVDPVTLVAAPLAENTLNVKKLSRILEKQIETPDGLDDEGRPTNYAVKLVVDRPLSIGPGQIYVYAAKRVEALAARIENRPMRKGGEIKDMLLTPEGALRYAAAILRDAQDTYAAGGVDISHRPEILATLYNIGKVKERLANAKGRDSLPNYFGYWVGLNYDYIKRSLNLPSVLDHTR